jgi:glutamine amidotransferase
MSQQIVIIDYGMGNLNSIKKKLSNLKTNVIISSNPELIQAADKIILPGVGHFARAMENITKMGILSVLNNEVLVNKKPILGIFLSMQLMALKS